MGGFYNPVVGNRAFADDNIAAFSSGGYSQAGNTLTLVAPGDANWALCSKDPAQYSGCADSYGGSDIGVQFFGGSSESAPLTAAAAADVVQAYAQAHGGTLPSPALVKEILTSSATDIEAPATQQGAGLLNILGAVELARSLPGPGLSTTRSSTTTSSTPPGTPATSPADPVADHAHQHHPATGYRPAAAGPGTGHGAISEPIAVELRRRRRVDQ